jgi:hypothetical protein
LVLFAGPFLIGLKFPGCRADESGVTSPYANHPESATIQLPSESQGGRRSIACIVHNKDSRRLILHASEALPAKTALSVEYSDAMFLGEVVACSPNGKNCWELDVRIEQILTGLQSLMALRANLIGESVPQPLAPVPVTRR